MDNREAAAERVRLRRTLLAFLLVFCYNAYKPPACACLSGWRVGFLPTPIINQYVLCDFRFRTERLHKYMDDPDLSLLTATKRQANGNCRYITISDNDPSHWDDLIKIAKSSYTHYWYIIHDKDVYGEDSDRSGELKPAHIHLVCFDRGGTTLKSHIERFSEVVEGNFVRKVKSSRAILRYLIHKDHPSKFQYDKGLVQSDYLPAFKQSIDDIQVSSKFDDYVKLIRKEITPSEYIEKYKYEINSLNFYQQQSVYKNIFQSYGLLNKD